jgi:sugar lactone lactonase YvrE
MWVKMSLQNERVDVYFRKVNYQQLPPNDTDNSNDAPLNKQWVVSSLAGTISPGYGEGSGTAARFSAPQGIAVDSNGIVYVADTGNNRIRKITPAGAVTSLAGTTSPGYAEGSGTAARFYAPQGIAVDSNGTVYVADALNNRIRKISYE